MYVGHHECALCQQCPEDNVGANGITVTDGSELPHGCWKSKLGSLESNKLFYLLSNLFSQFFFFTFLGAWRISYMIMLCFDLAPPIPQITFSILPPLLIFPSKCLHCFQHLLAHRAMEQRQPRRPSNNEIIMRMWYFYAMEFHSAVKTLKL